MAVSDGSYVEHPQLKQAPSTVEAAPRLQNDLQALQHLFSPKCPPHRVVRSTRRVNVFFPVGDASGLGFGTAVVIDGAIIYRQGVWSEQGGVLVVKLSIVPQPG